jgi:hypothetical protein
MQAMGFGCKGTYLVENNNTFTLEAQLSQCFEHKEKPKPFSSFPQFFVLLKKVGVKKEANLGGGALGSTHG